MSIKLKEDLRLLTERVEKLERMANLANTDKRTIAGQPEPDVEDTRPKKRTRRAKTEE